MKKIFTLIASVFLAMSANAQETALFSNSGTYGNGARLETENAYVELGNDRTTKNYDIKLSTHKAYCADFAQTVPVKNEDTGEMEDKSRVVYVVGNQNPKDGELNGDASSGSGYKVESANLPQSGTYYMLTTKKAGSVKAFIVLNSGKNFYVAKKSTGACLPINELMLKADGDEPTVVELAEDFTVAEKLTGTVEFNADADETYYIFCTGSKLSFGGYIFTPSSGDTPVAGEVDKYVAISAEGLAPEFAAVVGDGNVATNVVDNNSVVKVELPNITLEAVASATPKEVTKDAVTSWNDVKWEKKNQGDISFDYILGTGVCYTSWAYEEIIRDGEPTGEYRVLIGTDDNKWPNFYVTDGSHGLPISGLYYKYTPKVNGTLKMGIWMNKGNRRLFVVPSDTKAAIDYQVEGYINGQNGEDGKKKYLTNDEIRALGTDPYVMGAGNQPFWGYVTVGLEAGKDYYIFSQNAQVGFQGFEFTTGDTDGIENVQVV